MMEGEPATPGVTRLPDEETSFVGRKVEAPRRRQRRQQAKKKRIAVLGVSVVTMLVFGAVCAFLALPSGPTETMKTAVSQAMESDPANATATQVFIPSFAAYDEDGDGKVSLGEYLDRLAINRDAALKRVDESSLDDADKTQISDLLNEDFSKHSDCVALVTKQDEDTMMTKENFDEVYEEITTGFCPLSDDRIPNEYLLTETAPGEDELAPTEVDPTTGDSSTTSGSDEASASTSASEEAASTPSVESTSDGAAPPSNEIGWNPDQPTLPPRVIVDDDAKPEEGVGAGQWNPIYPSDPPIPAPSNDPQVNAWTPEEPTDPPSAVTADTKSEEDSASASQEAPRASNGVGEDEWNPVFPTEPPSPSSDKDQEQKAFSIGTMLDPQAAAYETPLAETSPESEQQAGIYNAYTGAETTGTQSNPEYKSPIAETAPKAEQAVGAFNSHSETTGTQSNPEVATEKKESEGIATYKSDTTTTGETATYGAPAGLQPTGAYNSYNAYQGYSNNYNKGAANTYTGAGTTYGNPSGQQPSGAYNQGYYSGYTGAANNGGAYNAYQGYSGHTGATNNAGAYNAYTGAGTTTYGGGQQTTGAYNTYNGYNGAGQQTGGGYNAYNGYTGAATAGTYKSYTGADGTTEYGESKGTRQLRSAGSPAKHL
ncbi:hypothetical protein PHYSODRAFT_336964 [Phytophthora sojae]|uniref:EF-hand domain-containing protein n=1 Tax=Phytophthora sojae (strain P6497) TaxID=1094619 RepID=G4ZXC8_PHYSP|nr:hypothetical protein PHYSODRAFT_336964 [Phytophthora sojae]EGZ12544.1 hypothetical protein PHYSODRAFT_336964 [Phytophthora sojae]|eukprot:XP_009532877.1 hypothetical protein PHYSODRAFT_336964 [Phytophthora sojae]